jgi:hypothetical protein
MEIQVFALDLYLRYPLMSKLFRSLLAVLPDLSWYNVPKTGKNALGKIYQMAIKYIPMAG